MLEKEFKDFGYSKEEYDIIRNTYPVINLADETLLKKFRENGQYLLSLGYSKEEVIKMTKTLPAIYGYSIENMKQKLEDMMTLGYSKEEAIKITKTLPTIYSYNIENMKQKLEEMMTLGYSKEEVIKMTKTLPSIYGLSIENIKQKLEEMLTLGYSNEEVIKMTKFLPTLYGLSIENIKQKIYFYDSIDMHQLAVEEPKFLMQSTALSYARYQFLLSKNIQVNMSNYRKLFMDAKKFEKQYGIKKEKLLEIYNYEKYLEEKENKIFNRNFKK